MGAHRVTSRQAVGGKRGSNLASIKKVATNLSGVEEGVKVLVGTSHKAHLTLVWDLVPVSSSFDEEGHVGLGICDASGALVPTLVAGALGPASSTATWNRTDQSGRRVAGGTYFYRLSVNGKSFSGKTVVLQWSVSGYDAEPAPRPVLLDDGPAVKQQ